MSQIRAGLEPGEFDAIERYLAIHPDLGLSDIYYNEAHYNKFRAWWKRSKLQSSPRAPLSRRNMKKLYVGPVYQHTPSGYKSIGERTVYAGAPTICCDTFCYVSQPEGF